MPANAGNMGLIPGSGRFPGEGSGNPPQNSCQENPKPTIALIKACLFSLVKFSWTEEPGGLQSMGSQRAEHDFVTKQENYNMSNSEEMQMLLISNCFFFLIAHLNKGRI